MKYLICMFMLLALSACERSSLESQSKTTSEKTLSYLNKPLQGKVSQYGLYRLVRSAGIINDPGTSTGKAVSNPVIEKVRSTEHIPLFKGVQMYMQYRIWSFPDQPAYVDLRRILKHPKMTLPDGSVSTGSEYMLKGKVSVNQVIAFTGYGFDEDYELVEGDWVFEIWYRGKKLNEQKFTTYLPNAAEQAVLQSQLKKKNTLKTDDGQKPFSRFNWPGKV